MPILKFRNSPKWYVDFSYRGVRHKWAVSTNKAVAVAFEAKLVDLIEHREQHLLPPRQLLTWATGQRPRLRVKLERLGLIEPSASETTPLAQSIGAYIAHLRAHDRDERHVAQVKARVERIAEALEATRLADFEPDAVAAQLKKLRSTGMTIATTNHYLTSLKSFFAWCVATGRLDANPLARLRRLNSQVGKKPRRPLTRAELDKMLGAITDANLYWLCRLAVETGLRAGELAGLERGDFEWGRKPTVTVRAAVSKSGRRATLPLRPETAKALRTHFESRDGPPFHRPDRLSERVRKALRAAGVDDADRDFHTLRHTFVTNLARAGVHPRVAQSLARHSTVTLTMEYYTHADEADLREAVKKLPQSRSAGTGRKTAKGTRRSRASRQAPRGRSE